MKLAPPPACRLACEFGDWYFNPLASVDTLEDDLPDDLLLVDSWEETYETNRKHFCQSDGVEKDVALLRHVSD